MEVELKEMLNDLDSLKRSLTDPSQSAPIDKVCINSDLIAKLSFIFGLFVCFDLTV